MRSECSVVKLPKNVASISKRTPSPPRVDPSNYLSSVRIGRCEHCGAMMRWLQHCDAQCPRPYCTVNQYYSCTTPQRDANGHSYKLGVGP
jgi:hypothetical protein